MRIAIIADGVVVNTIIADSEFVPESGFTAVETDLAGPGWTYDGAEFYPPVI